MKSFINEAKFTKRIPTEEYAFEEYTLGAAIDPSESGEDVLIEMRRQVNNAFAADLSPVEETASPKKEKKKTTKSKAKSAPKKTEEEPEEIEDTEQESDDETPVDVELEEDDDSSDEDANDEGSDENPVAEEEDDSEEEEEEEPAPKKEKKDKKVFKKKPQMYNRSIDQHREIFSRTLASVVPDWKRNKETKARAREVSISLEGEEFLDNNGEVVESFISLIKKAMTQKK